MQMFEQHLLNFCGLLGAKKKKKKMNQQESDHQRALTKPAFWAFNWKWIRNRHVKFPMKYTQGLNIFLKGALNGVKSGLYSVQTDGKKWSIPRCSKPSPTAWSWLVYKTIQGQTLKAERGSSRRGSAVNEPDKHPWGLGFDPWPRSVG